MVAEPVDRTSPSEPKIALFRSLFRGREDVYPRRFDLRCTLTDLGIHPVIRDERQPGSHLGVTLQGELRAEQRAAANAMLRHDTGVLAATTAFGKTVVAAWLIAERGVNTLVVVHRQRLLDQWIERLTAFLGIPSKSIGRIGGGRNRRIARWAIIQSLVRKGDVDDRVAAYGHVIVDECHHLSARSYEQLTRRRWRREWDSNPR